jgi:selenocysteine lyase/cysteine desulfurase
MGTPNVAGLFALEASLHLLSELGVSNIERHTTRSPPQPLPCLSG